MDHSQLVQRMKVRFGLSKELKRHGDGVKNEKRKGEKRGDTLYLDENLIAWKND